MIQLEYMLNKYYHEAVKLNELFTLKKLKFGMQFTIFKDEFPYLNATY